MEANEKRGFWYQVYVKGVFGRNRTVKFKGFTIAKSEVALPDAEVLALAKAKLAEIKVRGAYAYEVSEMPTTSKNGMISFVIFSDRKVHSEKVAA